MSNEEKELNDLLKSAGMPSDRELAKGAILFGVIVFAMLMLVYWAASTLPK